MKAIALSGYGMEEDVLQSLHAGFKKHLIKPVQSDVLERAIEEVMYEI
jgi:CheY-like chemotaxis protein